MRFRFLFVDDRGEEVYVSSSEDLARHVRSGALREEALLYDSLTREWAPARTHPTFARFRDDDAADAEEAGGAPQDPPPTPDDPEDDEEPDRSPLLEAPLPALEPLPEDAVQVDTLQLFLKEQELERWEEQRDQDRSEEDSLLLDGDGLDEVQRHAPISGSWGDTPPEPGDPGFESFLNAQRRWGRSQPPRGWSETGATDAGRTPRGGETPSALPGSGAHPRRSAVPSVQAERPRKSSALARWVRRTRARNEHRSRHAGRRQLLWLVPLVVVGGLGVAEAWGVSPLQSALVDAPGPDSLAFVVVPLTPDMKATEAEAFEEMVAGMEHLRRTMRVGEPPNTWMGGPYLSNALGFPEIRRYWVRYLAYVDTLRAREEDLFRSGFVTRLRLQGVTGPILSVRLARGLRDFQADAPRREATYASMEELARSALGLHDFLVDNADRIRYAPVDQGVNDDPILEAVPRDEGTKEALWTQIERLVQALDGVADADPLQRRDVSRSVLGSLALPESTRAPK